MISSQSTSEPRWERRAAIGGIVFVVLWIVSAILTSGAPDAGSSNADIASYYADGGERGKLSGAGYALAFGGIFFLWFLGSLRTLLRRAEGEPARLSALAFGGGVAMIAMFFVGSALKAGPAGAFDYADNLRLDPELVKVLDSISFWLLSQGAMAGGVMVGAASVLALRTRLLPRWFGWAGLVVAGLAFLAVPLFLVPIVLVAAWILVVSVLMLRRPAQSAEPSTAPATV